MGNEHPAHYRTPAQRPDKNTQGQRTPDLYRASDEPDEQPNQWTNQRQPRYSSDYPAGLGISFRDSFEEPGNQIE